MRRFAVVAASMVAAAVLSSCSSGPGLSAKAATELDGQVQAVRASAVGHDRTRAAAQLAQLRLQVTQLQQQGQISPARAKAILDAVSAVQAQLASIPLPPPTTVFSPPATAPAPQSSQDQHGHGGDNTGGGNGGGDGGGDGH